MENLSHSEIIEQINKELPNWIVDIAEKYDENYSQFTKNWNLICEKLKLHQNILLSLMIFHILKMKIQT